MNSLDLGKMISKLRKKKNLTQAELGNMLNVSDKAISKWENGLGYPEITQLPLLSEIFGVSIDFLLKGNPKGIVIAGNIIVDVLNIIDKYPDKTMLGNVLSTERAVGGCVSNTIIDLAKIDPDLFLTAIGKVGNDENGRFVVSKIQSAGVDVSKISVSSSQPTSSTHVMSEKETGERTFFYAKGANGEFSIDDIDVDSLECNIFHIGYLFLLDALDEEDKEYGTKMARLLDMISKKGIKTSIDAISSAHDDYDKKIIPSLKYCDYAIMNEIESAMVSKLSARNSDGTLNIKNIEETMKMFIDCGVREKVIIHASEAGFLMGKDKKMITVPSLQLPDGFIKGSVGAGDAYAAGSLYGLYKGYDDVKILEFASCCAAMSLSEADSISGMKSRKYIEELGKKYKRKNI